MHPRFVKGAQSESLPKVHGPPEMTQPPSTRLARPREAGKWLEPATRGPTHLGPYTSSTTRAPERAGIQLVEAATHTAHPHEPSQLATSDTTSSCCRTDSSSPPNSAGLPMLKAPVASRSAIVSSESRLARSAASARSRNLGPSSRTLSRIPFSWSDSSGPDACGEMGRTIRPFILASLHGARQANLRYLRSRRR